MIKPIQAEQALACIKRQFQDYLGAGCPEPTLVENWKPFIYRDGGVQDTDPIPFAVLWEEGPDDWAYRAHSGGRDVELTLELRSVPGIGETATVDTPPATEWPPGVSAEPYFSYVLGLYEE